jgi:superfamily I DNA and RNA helicase
MSTITCKEIKEQLMFYLDNELNETAKNQLIEHLRSCCDCMDFLYKEKQMKDKICDKLKDSYVCKCDTSKLEQCIKDKIQEIIKGKF